MSRVTGSAYMQWAKLNSGSRFNLAVSGMPSYPLSELPVKLEDLELSRGGAYGYGRLPSFPLLIGSPNETGSVGGQSVGLPMAPC